MIRRLEQLSYEDRLRKLGIFNLKRRLPGDLLTAFQYLKLAYKKDGEYSGKILMQIMIGQELMVLN